jgi:UDP-N-acetylmuramoylalanine--D-glutamate ligase
LRSGAPVVSELELAYQVSAAPIVAVTGTNGKTTTTALIEHLLVTAGIRARAAGNIGIPALDVARALPADGVLVTECSSFQLALTLEFKPRVAVMARSEPTPPTRGGCSRIKAPATSPSSTSTIPALRRCCWWVRTAGPRWSG